MTSPARDESLEHHLRRHEAKWRLLRELYHRWLTAKKRRTEVLSALSKRIQEQEGARDLLCRNDRPDDVARHLHQITKAVKKLDGLRDQQAEAKRTQGGIVEKHEASFREALESDQIPLFPDDWDGKLVAEATLEGRPIAVGMGVDLDGSRRTVVGIRAVDGEEMILVQGDDDAMEITCEPGALHVWEGPGGQEVTDLPTIEGGDVDEPAPRRGKRAGKRAGKKAGKKAGRRRK